ncbi:pyridoxal phosphate-dependent transferase [Globomyces pollinis-pini]|nr:pyridoxal phosphate-dependent transferase [Globomyces pollinis-pini]
MFDLKKAVRPNILKLKPYRCARDDYSAGILLDANENTHGPALDDVSKYTQLGSDLERYPDPYQVEVKELLCKFRNIPSTNYFYLGVGSDEVIDMAIRVFVTPGKEKILITPPTYGMYSVCAQINDVETVKIPLIVDDGAFQLNVIKILDAIKSDPLIKIVFLCSPGNPTGTLLQENDIKQILECSDFNGVVLVDEAYIDFCETSEKRSSVCTWVTKYPNLIVTQTLSKAFGLAGIRLGLSIANPEITQIFNNTKAPYNISTPTSMLGRDALSAAGLKVMRAHIESIQKQRVYLIDQLSKLPFVSRFLGAHDANFILVQFANSNGEADNNVAMSIYKQLAEIDGVVVRFRGMELGCEGCLRITVGTEEENKILMAKLSSEIMSNFAK